MLVVECPELVQETCIAHVLPILLEPYLAIGRGVDVVRIRPQLEVGPGAFRTGGHSRGYAEQHKC